MFFIMQKMFFVMNEYEYLLISNSNYTNILIIIAMFLTSMAINV